MRDRKILILYGTETGNSELLAMDAEKLANDLEFDVTVNGMDEITLSDIQDNGNVLIVCSTWGDGEQPDNAIDLYESVEGSDDASMSGVGFAVLALGDTAFDLFCEAGIQWDNILQEKGGNRISERIDCDVDYEDDAEAWIEDTLNLFKETWK
jgi:sulfite reductase (NADPH) flavoprotein alpha-component